MVQIDEDSRADFTALYEAQYAPVMRYTRREVPEHAASDVVAEKHWVRAGSGPARISRRLAPVLMRCVRRSPRIRP
ncbi:hypothetical protein FAGKG844_10137 [Frankia sp. AgKG'84/4]